MWLLLVLWLVSVMYCCGLTVADPDLWGHTLYGLRASEQGLLVERNDPFSYTAVAAPWVNHEWLTEYQFGYLWKTFGDLGLWFWRNLLVMGVFGVGVLVVHRAQASLGAATVLFFFTAECLSGYCLFVRPQLATFLLFAMTLAILRVSWERETKLIWLLPLLTALWTNLHGGFLAGLAIQGVFIAGFALRAIRQTTLRKRFAVIASIGLLSLIATGINPYGFELHRMLWQHLIPAQAVREWQPLWSVGQNVNYYLPGVVLLVTLAGWRRWSWIDIVIIALVAVQAALHVRHVALLAITVLILAPGPLTEACRSLFPGLSEKWSQGWRGKGAATVAVASLALILLHLPTNVKLWQHGIMPWQIAVESRRDAPGMPVRATEIVKSLGLRGNLITDYSWGQFVIWQLYPDCRVAFDGRYRTVYPPDLEKDFLDFQRLDGDGPSSTPILDDYPTELALLSAGSSASRYLASRPDWLLIYDDDQASLYVRDLPKFANVVRAVERGNIGAPRVLAWNRFPADNPVTPPRNGMVSFLDGNRRGD